MKDKDLLSALLKGVDTGSTGAMSSIDQSNKLAQLLKQDELKQLAIARNQAAVDNQAMLQGLKPGQYSTSVGAEHYNITPKDNSTALANLFERKAARDDRDRIRLSEQASRAGLPESVASIKNIENITGKGSAEGGIFKNPNYQMKSVGPIANTIRGLPGGTGILNVGERLGMMPKGASEEDSAAQDLRNQVIKMRSGAQVSGHEAARMDRALGMSAAADPEIARQGLLLLKEIIAAKGAGLQAGHRKEIVQEYKSAGGVLVPEDVGLGEISAQTNTVDHRAAALAELARRKGKK